MPRKFLFITYIFSSFTLTFISYLGFLFENLNKMNLVFLIFKDTLLTFYHSATLLNSVCTVLRVFKLLLLQEIVVLSANSVNDSKLLLFSMSFIYIKC
jgi:hypothetical protein